MAAPQNAIEVNQQLFQRFAQMLSTTDAGIYGHHAQRLATWLGDEKAYYTAARPEIVRLLLIAQKALRRAVGYTEDFKVAFNVWNYGEHLMVMPYVKLMKAIEPFVHRFDGDAQSIIDHVRSSIATITPNSSVSISESSSQPLLQPNTPLADVKQTTAPEDMQVNPLIRDTELQHETLKLGQSQTLSAPATLQQTKKAKIKKQKFNLLVQRDIQGLLKKGTLPQLESSRHEGTPSVEPAVPQPAVDATAQDVPPNILVTERPVPAIAEVQSVGVGMDTHLESVANEHLIPANIDGDKRERIQELNQMMDVEPSLEPPVVVSNPIVSSKETIAQRSQAELILVRIEEMRLDGGGRAEQQIGEKDLFAVDPYTHLALTAAGFPDEQNPMDIDDNTNIFQIQPTLTLLDSTTHWMLEPPTIDSAQAESTIGIFGPEMRIIAYQRGLKEDSLISIGFDIPEAQYNLVLQWNQRLKSAQDLKSSICLTLGCYLLTALQETSKCTNLDTFEKRISCTVPEWPQRNGSLSLKVVNGETHLPLSPPFLITPDSLVDISEFIVLGKNVFELRQGEDLSKYLFVLHAHYATRRQLQQIEDRKEKDREWHNFLRRASAPFPHRSIRDLGSS